MLDAVSRPAKASIRRAGCALVSLGISLAGCGFLVGDYAVDAGGDSAGSDEAGSGDDSALRQDTGLGMQDAGPDAALEGDAVASLCGLPPFYKSSCMECVNANCCLQERACLNDTDCYHGYVECALGCLQDASCSSFADCTTGCAGTVPGGVGYYKFTGTGGYGSDEAVDECVYSACQGCTGTCPNQ